MFKNILATTIALTVFGVATHAFAGFRQPKGTACEIKIKKRMLDNELVFAELGRPAIDGAVKVVNEKLAVKNLAQTLQLSETRTHEVLKISAVTVLDNEGVEQMWADLELSQDTPKWPLVLEMKATVKSGENDYFLLVQTTNYDGRCHENVAETSVQKLHLNVGELQIHETELNAINDQLQSKEETVKLPSGAKFLPSVSRVYGGKFQRAHFLALEQGPVYVYGSRKIPLVELVSKPHESIVRFNPLTAAYENLESIQIDSVIDGKTAATNVINFSKSNEYGENIEGTGVRNFAASTKIWNARLLSGSADGLNEVSFDEQDFEAGQPPVVARLTTNQELGYDNLDAYWYLKSQAKGSRERSKEAEYTYVVEARKDAVSKDSALLSSTANVNSPFLKTTEYVQPNIPTIKNAAKKLMKNFTGTRVQMAQKILKYMPELIEFDEMMIDENVIVPLRTTEILGRGKGVCQHFANVFAALARATGIPTRIVSGYTFDAKMLFGHAWNEIEIREGIWLPIEPQYAGVFDMEYWQYLPLAVSAELDDPTRKEDLVREQWLLTNFIFSLKKIEKKNNPNIFRVSGF